MFISDSDYVRSNTHSFEEKNEVKFKQDNKYQLEQCGMPENIPYILTKGVVCLKNQRFLDQMSRYAWKWRLSVQYLSQFLHFGIVWWLINRKFRTSINNIQFHHDEERALGAILSDSELELVINRNLMIRNKFT